MLRKLAANRSLIKNLVVRDLKQRYVGSIGGFLWSVIRPIVLLISYTFLFTVILGQRLGPQFGTDSFAIFFFCGFLPWLLFSDTVIRNCSAITDNAPMCDAFRIRMMKLLFKWLNRQSQRRSYNWAQFLDALKWVGWPSVRIRHQLVPFRLSAPNEG